MESEMLLTKLSDVREAAPDFGRSDALAKLSVDARWLHSISDGQMH